MSNEYDAVRMQLYGLYKVAKEGKCQEPKPKPDTVSYDSGRCPPTAPSPRVGEQQPEPIYSNIFVSVVHITTRDIDILEHDIFP